MARREHADPGRHSGRTGRGEGADERAPIGQWVGFFLAPAVFFAHLQIAYALVPWACVRDGELWIHVVGVASVLLALAGIAAAWRVWARTGRGAPGEDGGAVPRTRFLAVSGLCMSTMFALLLLAQWVTAFFISPCQ